MTARASGRRHLVLGTIAVAAVSLPFLSVSLPPIADLPQQAAQIRLLHEALADPGGAYRVAWWGPNRLSYLLLGGAWRLVGPEHAGRVALLAIGLLWVAAAFALARGRGRPPEAAVLASLVFFNHTTYWGLYSFSIGLPIFALFVDLSDRLPDRLRWRDGALVLAGLLLLFLSHAFWLAAGVAWLGVSAAAFRGPGAALARLAPAAPVLAWAYLWNRTLEGTALDSPPVWHRVARWTPEWLVDATLGGLRGRVDDLLAAALAAWILAGAARRAAPARRATSAAGSASSAVSGPTLAPAQADRWDRPLAAAAALLAAAAFVLPDGTHGTIRVAARWMPMAAFLLLLAAPSPSPSPSPAPSPSPSPSRSTSLSRSPAPSRPRRLAAALACALALAFSARTAQAWRAVESHELSGLAESVAALPERPRVLGLDLVKESAHVRGRPFLQGSAYAQVARGGVLGFTFAVFPSSLVLRRTYVDEPWTKNLVWSAERATRADAECFDYVLVNAAGDAAHARAAESLGLAAVTRDGRWRLYRVAPRPAYQFDGRALAALRARERWDGWDR